MILILNVLLVFLGLAGAAAGFGPISSKLVVLFPILFACLIVYRKYFYFNRDDFRLILIFGILGVPGLLPVFETPSVLLYYCISFFSILALSSGTKNVKKDIRNEICLSLNILLVYLITIRISTGALYIVAIQPSVLDMLILTLYCAARTSKRRVYRHYFLDASIIMYGFVYESRIIMLLPFAMPVISFFAARFILFTRSVLFLGFCGTLLVLLASILYLSDGALSLRGSIADLESVFGFEAKRISLIFNGIYVLREAGILGVGFGPDAYLKVSTDNPLGIAPQFLPLSLAVYAGPLYAVSFIVLVYRYIAIDLDKNPGHFAAKLILFSFIFVHEYVFNPLFIFSILLLNMTRVFEIWRPRKPNI